MDIEYFPLSDLMLEQDQETCHCNDPIIIHHDGFTRYLCQICDSARCDAYPGSCGK